MDPTMASGILNVLAKLGFVSNGCFHGWNNSQGQKMLRQSPSRNSRANRFKLKVKRAGQICLLLTIFIWLLHQVKHSHYVTKERQETSPKSLLNTAGLRHMIIKLGRKDISGPRIHASLEKGSQGKEKEPGEDLKDFREEEEEEEEEDEEDIFEGRGVGDDEIDADDQEMGEEDDPDAELEDLKDEEDQLEDASVEGETQ
ncbi:hypothetical protein SAY86_011744 [Trapa natans]|uniref:Uncharacterized protein n=1 Tax=Trapa natans TaxID=22666 RepID=A0AAN7LZU6_TRANT|nr:hypothetical protein SAY86_011744 [Trapa natans]